MKIVFVDCEFTGEHAFATLVSVGLVTLEGEELYVTLNDFDRSQVTPWLEENVLIKFDPASSLDSKQACERVSSFLQKYSCGEPVTLVSAGKLNDLTLVFQLWHTMFPSLTYFHFGKHLPSYLNHRLHFDLDTLFFAAGIDPNISREKYVGEIHWNKKHEAIYDARVVRLCFLKLVTTGRLPHIASKISNQVAEYYDNRPA